MEYQIWQDGYNEMGSEYSWQGGDEMTDLKIALAKAEAEMDIRDLTDPYDECWALQQKINGLKALIWPGYQDEEYDALVSHYRGF